MPYNPVIWHWLYGIAIDDFFYNSIGADDFSQNAP